MQFFNRATFENLSSKVIVTPSGFKAAVVQDVFTTGAYQKLLAAFPLSEIFTYHEDQYKKVFEGPSYNARQYRGCIERLSGLDPIWKAVLLEASSDEFLKLFSNATGVAFNAVREFSLKYGKEGCEIKPHLDQAAKTQNEFRSQLVSLFYFAPKPGMGPGGTTIYSPDRSTILLEAQDLYNSMLFFEQHADAWHGYRPLKSGEERRAMILTFNLAKHPVRIKTSLGHKLFCPRCLPNFFSR